MSPQTNSDESVRIDVEQHAELLQTLSCVRYVGVVMVVAATVLLVFNSAGLQTWTRNLDGNAITDRWVTEADTWHSAMSRLGFASPKVALQQAMVETRELTWFGAFGATTAHADEESFTDDEHADDWSLAD